MPTSFRTSTEQWMRSRWGSKATLPLPSTQSTTLQLQSIMEMDLQRSGFFSSKVLYQKWFPFIRTKHMQSLYSFHALRSIGGGRGAKEWQWGWNSFCYVYLVIMLLCTEWFLPLIVWLSYIQTNYNFYLFHRNFWTTLVTTFRMPGLNKMAV